MIVPAPHAGRSHSRLIEHVAKAPVPDSVHEPATVPGQSTEPVGVEVDPVDVSVTVAVQEKG